MTMQNTPLPRRSRAWVLVLLAVPYVALLVPGWYARADPRFSGIPFFIWYQFAWVIISAALTIAVYRVVGDREDPA